MNPETIETQESVQPKVRIFFMVNGVVHSYKAYTQNFLHFIRTAQKLGYEIVVSGFRKTNIYLPELYVTKKIVYKKSLIGFCKLILSNCFELLLHKYDIVVTGSLYTPTLLLYYLALLIRRPKKIVYYMQDPIPESFRDLKKTNDIKNYYII